MTYQSLLPRLILTVTHFLYWLDRYWWRPASLANDIYDRLEVRGLCCERHSDRNKAVA